MKLKIFAGLAMATACASVFAAAPATMNIVVPYPAGGTTDVIARSLQNDLEKAFGVTVIVENKPGAAGVIAARHVATAKPDGYTMLLSNNGPSVVGPLMQPSAGIDPLKSLEPVTLLTRSPMMFMVQNDVPAKNIQEFIDFAKKSEHPVEYASAGQGSYGHLSTELFAKEGGVELLHVPYKGVAPTSIAVASGEVKLLFSTFSQAMQGMLDQGRVRLLAVGSAEPSPLMPDVPTVAQTLPGFLAEAWFGIQVPAGTPQDMITKLNEVMVGAIRSKDVADRMAATGMIVDGSTPEAFGEVLKAEVDRLGPLVTELGLVEK